MTRMSIEQAMELGRQHHRGRQLAEAARVYEQVLAASPGNVEAMQLLGLVALDMNRPEMAAELFARGISLQPGNGELHYNLGVARLFLNLPEQAVEAFRKAIALSPALIPAHGNLAAALLSLQRYDEAIEASRAALRIHPGHPNSLNNLGVALKETGRLEEAAEQFQQAVKADSKFSQAWTNLAGTLQKLRQTGPAIEAYRAAIRLAPDQAELHHGLGRVLADENQLDAARQSFEAAIRLRSNFADSWTNLANVLHGLGRYDQGIAAARKAIALAPENALPKYNLSLMLLLRGQFDEGWRLHESRFDVPQLGMKRYDFGRPLWNGEDLAGRTILLSSEQGIGDTIQFIRYIPRVLQRGGRIILGCNPALVRLMQRFPGIDKVVSDIDPSLEFDVTCTLMSLPMIFQTTEATIPREVPYLSAHPEDVAKWKSRLRSDPERRQIGLVWAGRPGHGNDHNRSMKLDQLGGLSEVKGVRFHSLQKGEATAQLKSPPPGLDLMDWSGELTDLAETAGLMENLDLVITVDTSVAHLAGSLGRPTWLLLPFVPDWRWMLDRTDSPWYPTMRLFRQHRAGDWAGVIREVVDALRGN